MEININKREHDTEVIEPLDEPQTKSIKTTQDIQRTRFAHLRHGHNRPLPKATAEKMTEEDAEIMVNVKTSCTDLDKIREAIKVRQKYRLACRLPEDFNDSTYYIDNGLRRVYPYPYIYQTYAKRRWLGCKLKDILKNEFRDITDEELKKRFENNRILVNGDIGDFEHTMKDNDSVCNLNHRHELPVIAAPVKIVHMDDEIIVVNKPPSVPIHPCGRYRHNSILFILRNEYNLPDVKVVHRLDRLVSGILILARTTRKASEFERALKEREVQKEYVCRVVGEFPLAPDDGEIVVNEPLEVIHNKIGISVCMPGGKPSTTTFKRLNYNGKTSAVLCKPKSGRMHQIRVHLQYLGHPIVNDGLYNCDSFGPLRGKGGDFGGKSIKQVSDDVVSKHRSDVWLMPDATDYDDGLMGDNVKIIESSCKTDEFLSEEEKNETLAALEHFYADQSWTEYQNKWKFDPDKLVMDPNCRDCKSRYYDPPKRNLFLYLHAFKYSGKGWSYETELPGWAKDTWKY